MIEVYIGIGSNLDEPLQHVKQAISELRQLAHSEYIATSALYRSSPMGPADQPDYINAVSLLQTDLVPLELLDQLQSMLQHPHSILVNHHCRVRNSQIITESFTHTKFSTRYCGPFKVPEI